MHARTPAFTFIETYLPWWVECGAMKVHLGAVPRDNSRFSL